MKHNVLLLAGLALMTLGLGMFSVALGILALGIAMIALSFAFIPTGTPPEDRHTQRPDLEQPDPDQ